MLLVVLEWGRLRSTQWLRFFFFFLIPFPSSLLLCCPKSLGGQTSESSWGRVKSKGTDQRSGSHQNPVKGTNKSPRWEAVAKAKDWKFQLSPGLPGTQSNSGKGRSHQAQEAVCMCVCVCVRRGRRRIEITKKAGTEVTWEHSTIIIWLQTNLSYSKSHDDFGHLKVAAVDVFLFKEWIEKPLSLHPSWSWFLPLGSFLVHNPLSKRALLCPHFTPR